MVRVVADTNVFISALMFGGLPGSFLDLALLESFLLVTALLHGFVGLASAGVFDRGKPRSGLDWGLQAWFRAARGQVLGSRVAPGSPDPEFRHPVSLEQLTYLSRP